MRPLPYASNVRSDSTREFYFPNYGWRLFDLEVPAEDFTAGTSG